MSTQPLVHPSTPTTRSIALRLTGDDRADEAAARWAEPLARQWNVAVTGRAAGAAVPEPADVLVVCGVPGTGATGVVEAAAKQAVRHGHPVVFVPSFWHGDPATTVRTVTVGLPDVRGERVVETAARIAGDLGHGLTLVRLRRTTPGDGTGGELDGLGHGHDDERLAAATDLLASGWPALVVQAEVRADDTFAWLAACEHLTTLLVLGLDGDRATGFGRWAAAHCVVPTVLVPIGPAA